MIEATHEPALEQEAVFYFEVLDNQTTSRLGLTPMEYDDEIGLWEELLHRGNQSKIDPR
jgi:hypothetical protein